MTIKSRAWGSSSLLLAGMLVLAAQTGTEAAGVAATATGTINQPNVAARELDKNAMREQSRSSMSIPMKNVYVPRSSVQIKGNKWMSEKRIRKLLPELEREEMNVRRLSQQLQLANSSGAVQLAVKLLPEPGGKFGVLITADEKKREHVITTVTNGGNQLTGDWRMVASYVNSNLTERADTLGVSYVASPGHWDDVRQAAVSYRVLMPRVSGELNFFAGWSKVDLGTIYRADGTGYHLDMEADGSSNNVGMRYTKHLSYSNKEKDAWELGFERKYYKNNWKLNYNLGGIANSEATSYDYAINEFSLRFSHQELKPKSFFAWNVGLLTNVDGKAADFRKATGGADAHYTMLRGGAQYQYRLKHNWLASTRFMAQYTEDNIISPQQLGVGGMNNTLRGYNERTLNGDRGVLGSLELMTPEVLPHTRMLLFTDYASLHNNNPRAAWRHEGASTAGLGLRFNDKADRLYISLDYVAKIMNDIKTSSSSQPGRKRWNLVLTKVF